MVRALDAYGDARTVELQDLFQWAAFAAAILTVYGYLGARHKRQREEHVAEQVERKNLKGKVKRAERETKRLRRKLTRESRDATRAHDRIEERITAEVRHMEESTAQGRNQVHERITQVEDRLGTKIGGIQTTLDHLVGRIEGSGILSPKARPDA